MATNPQHTGYERSGWPGKGKTMTEDAYHELERLSPGTEVRDRGIKLKAYQQCPTIQEIVLVSQFAQYVEIWQRNEQEPDNPKVWSYRHYGPGDTIDFASIEGAD